jgi:hypothetical protein
MDYWSNFLASADPGSIPWLRLSAAYFGKYYNPLGVSWGWFEWVVSVGAIAVSILTFSLVSGMQRLSELQNGGKSSK